MNSNDQSADEVPQYWCVLCDYTTDSRKDHVSHAEEEHDLF